MPAPASRHATAVAAVTAAAVLFATTGTARSLGPAEADAWAVGTWRIVLGALALWVVARGVPRPTPADRASMRVLLLGSVGVAAYQPGFFIATDRCGVALGTLIALGSGPVFTVAGEALTRGSRPPGGWWLATSAMVAGVALLGAGDDSAGVVLDGWGVVAGLGAGAGYALYAVATRRAIDAGVGSTRALAWQFSIGALILSPGLLIASSDGLGDPAGLLMIAHLGVLTVGLAYFLYGVGLRRLAPSTAVSITVIEPVAATV
ncbi:MAG: DMT family transporter, partial [Ilumatobacteraceae bacterium]